MPPKDITQTGPQTGAQLQQQNDEFTQYFGDYREWASYKDLKKQGFNDDQISRLYRNAVFKYQYGSRVDFDRWAKSMSPEQRDNILIMQVAPKQKLNRIPGANFEEPASPFGPVDMQRVYSNAYQDKLAEEAVSGSTELTPIENDRQAAALYKKLEKEALELYPDASSVAAKSIEEEGLTSLGRAAMVRNYGQTALGEKLLRHPIGPATAYAAGMSSAADDITFKVTGDINDPSTKRALYIQMNMKVPQNDNNFYNLSEAEFYRLLPVLSDTYNRYNGTYLIPKDEENIHQLYLDNKKYLDAGLLYKASANIDRYYNGVIGKRQPKGFKGGELIRGKTDVLLSSAAGASVENTLNLIASLDPTATLPTLTHKLGKTITGDNAVAYGNGWTDAFFNSGTTFGAMISEMALAFLTHKATSAMKGATSVGRAIKKYGDVSNALMAGVREGTMDAVELRNELLEKAEQIAVTLPENQREEFLRNATHEANTAYGRTLIEEAAIVDAGTLMGLGFLGAINAPKAGSRFAMGWQKKLVPTNKWAKWGVGAGHVFEKVGTRTLGELLEEYGQGLASGVNKARATDNINNYAMALRYGLGSQYMNDAHIGVLQGLFGYTPQAWSEMDPENLTKQVLVSTLLFNGVHIPGTGKTRQRIEAESNNKLGKVLDYIHKYSPIQTGIGEIASEVREIMHGQENALTAGWNALLHDNDVINVLQTQAALADIGIQMADAAERKDISDYQKTSAAYYAAQAVMLANATGRGAKFGQTYLDVLNNRANISSLSPEEQAKMLSDIESEVPMYLKDLAPEERLKAIESVAQRSLDLVKQAQDIFAKYHETGLDAETDVRPLVFAELLNNLAPEIIEENWKTISPSLDKIFKESDIQTRGNETHQRATKLLIDNYFSQSDFNSRTNFLYNFTKGKIEGISEEEANAALTEVTSEIRKEVPIIDDVIKSDISLSNWRSDIYSNWNKMYQNVMKGEGTLSTKSANKIFNLFKAAQRVHLNKLEKDYYDRITNAKMAGQVASIIDKMEADESISPERLANLLSVQFKDDETVKEALKIRDAARDMKNILRRDIPSDNPIREYLPTLEAIIDRASHMVDSREDLLSLSTFSGVSDPRLAMAIAHAIVEASKSSSINISDTPVSEHTDEEILEGTASSTTEKSESPTPTEGAELVEGVTSTSSTEKTLEESKSESVQTKAQEYIKKVEDLNSNVISLLNLINSGQVDPGQGARDLTSIKETFQKLEKEAPGDELRSQIREAIDKLTKSIQDVMGLESTAVLPKLQVRKRKKVFKEPYWEGIKAFKKDVISFFREAKKSKQNTTPEDFISKFWNPSYEHFVDIRKAFMSLIDSNGTESEREIRARELFEDYFTNNKKLRTNRKGQLDFIAEDIIRQTLGLVSEDDEIRGAGALTYKEYVEAVSLGTSSQNKKYMAEDLTSDDYMIKESVRGAISGLIRRKGTIIDAGGEIVDSRVRWVAHKLKNGSLPKRKNGITLDDFVDENFNAADKGAAIELIRHYAHTGVPTKEELLYDEYQRYLAENKVWARIDDSRFNESQTLDWLALQGFYDEMDAFEREVSAEYLRELSQPIPIKVALGNKGKTYDYSTTSLEYEKGQTVQVMTPYGPATATIVGYGNRGYNGTLKSLDDILIPSVEQAKRNIQRTLDEESGKTKKHKVAIQSAFTSSTEKIKESHGEVLTTLEKAGAKEFIMRGNLHEGDELGFVVGTWESPEGTRPVVYIVTKKIYDNGSNGNPLFKGHQVIGVFDTDAATDDSEVWNIINDYRKNVSVGDYFEVPNLPIHVSNVSSSGVKYKSIVGLKRDSHVVEDTNLNKILDESAEKFGITYDGETIPVVFISNVDGTIQSSDPNYSLDRIFDPSRSAAENSKRIISSDTEGMLPEKVTLMVIPTPSGDTAQIVVYAIDDTIEDFYPRVSNLLSNSVVGESIKKDLKSRMMYLWRTAKGVRDLEKVPFTLNKYFRLNGEGIAITYKGGNFIFSLGNEKVLFTTPFDVADINQASKTSESTESLFEGMRRNDDKTVVDVAWELLSTELSKSDNPIIRAVNLSVTNMANNPELAQELISTGTLYAPNADLDSFGKITLDNASFTAYADGTQPEKKVNTSSRDSVAPTSTQSEIKTIAQQSQETSTKSAKKSSKPKEVSEGLVAGPARLTGKRKDLRPKTESNSNQAKLFNNNTDLFGTTNNSTSDNIPSNSIIATLPYKEAIKYADISVPENVWDTYSSMERLQHLNCK